MRSLPVLDRVLLDMDSGVRDKIKYANGLELYMDTWGNREEKATPVAKVYSVGVTSTLGLKEGDMVSISYHVMSGYDIKDGVTTYRNKHYIDKTYLWLAESEHIHAVWRDGRWHPVGDWVMLSPVKWTETILGVDMEREYMDRGIDTDTGEVLLFGEAFRSEYTVPDIVDGEAVGYGTKYIILPKRCIRENMTRPGAWQYSWTPPVRRGGMAVFVEPIRGAQAGSGLILPENATTGRLGKVTCVGWSVSTVRVGDTVQWKGGVPYEGKVLCSEEEVVCVVSSDTNDAAATKGYAVGVDPYGNAGV